MLSFLIHFWLPNSTPVSVLAAHIILIPCPFIALLSLLLAPVINAPNVNGEGPRLVRVDNQVQSLQISFRELLDNQGSLSAPIELSDKLLNITCRAFHWDASGNKLGTELPQFVPAITIMPTHVNIQEPDQKPEDLAWLFDFQYVHPITQAKHGVQVLIRHVLARFLLTKRCSRCNGPVANRRNVCGWCCMVFQSEMTPRRRRKAESESAKKAAESGPMIRSVIKKLEAFKAYAQEKNMIDDEDGDATEAAGEYVILCKQPHSDKMLNTGFLSQGWSVQFSQMDAPEYVCFFCFCAFLFSFLLGSRLLSILRI